MQCTFPPLEAMVVISLLTFLTGKPAKDLSPTNGATAACALEPRLTVVDTAGEEIMEAISFSP